MRAWACTALCCRKPSPTLCLQYLLKTNLAATVNLSIGMLNSLTAGTFTRMITLAILHESKGVAPAHFSPNHS